MTAPRKTASRKSRPAPKLASVSSISFFGPAPVLDGEDGAAYDELLAQVSSSVKPTDAIEEIWVRDVVDRTWEILRFRRIKNSLFAEGLRDSLRAKLISILREPEPEKEPGAPYELLPITYSPPAPWVVEADELIDKWAAGNRTARERVDKLLSEANVTMMDLMPSALLENLEKIDQVEQMILSSERCRNSVLREIEHRRAMSAKELRNSLQNVEDAEFETVRPKAIELNNKSKKDAA